MNQNLATHFWWMPATFTTRSGPGNNLAKEILKDVCGNDYADLSLANHIFNDVCNNDYTDSPEVSKITMKYEAGRWCVT